MVCLFVCLIFVSYWPPFVHFGQLLVCADKRIVNIMKVYIERNNLQVELTRCYKNVDFILVYFCEARNLMQYRPPNGNLDSCCQTVSIVTGDNGWSHLADLVGHSIAALTSVGHPITLCL